LPGVQRGKDVAYPFTKKSEPGKRVRLLADDAASGRSVDRIFMQVRRSTAGLERAPQYPRPASRVPEMVSVTWQL
jgi:hypothetical protein